MFTELNSWAVGQTWAIVPEMLTAAMQAARRGEVSPRTRLPRVDGSVAVLPVHGMISQRGSPLLDLFGGTSTQGFEAAFQRAIDSDRIKAVVLDVDSPGGTTAGVELASDRVFAARGSKPIVAVANSQAGSAAYWIASSADSFVAAPGGDVGSIGVFRLHENHQAALEQAGVDVTFISRPEFKTEANPFEPLSVEARAFHQDQVDATFGVFNRAVARNRGVTPAQAKAGFGKGRMFHAGQAAELGMVDRVASLGKVLAELGVGTGRARTSEATAELTRELCTAYWEGDLMPFGHNCEYKDFAACVADQQANGHNHEEAEAICGALMRDTEAKCENAAFPIEVKKRRLSLDALTRKY